MGKSNSVPTHGDKLVSKIDELGQWQLDAIRAAVAPTPSRASQLPGAQPLSC